MLTQPIHLWGPVTHGNIFLRFCLIVYCSQGNREQPAHYLKRFPAFLYCLLFSRESRTSSSLLETIQKRRKTFPCVRGLSILAIYIPR